MDKGRQDPILHRILGIFAIVQPAHLTMGGLGYASMHLCHSQSSLHSSCHSDQLAASLADCFTVLPHLDKPGSSIRETSIFRASTWLRDLKDGSSEKRPLEGPCSSCLVRANRIVNGHFGRSKLRLRAIQRGTRLSDSRAAQKWCQVRRDRKNCDKTPAPFLAGRGGRPRFL